MPIIRRSSSIGGYSSPGVMRTAGFPRESRLPIHGRIEMIRPTEFSTSLVGGVSGGGALVSFLPGRDRGGEGERGRRKSQVVVSVDDPAATSHCPRLLQSLTSRRSIVKTITLNYGNSGRFACEI